MAVSPHLQTPSPVVQPLRLAAYTTPGEQCPSLLAVLHVPVMGVLQPAWVTPRREQAATDRVVLRGGDDAGDVIHALNATGDNLRSDNDTAREVIRKRVGGPS